MSKQEQPQYDLNEKFYIFDNFITSIKHILERGDDDWDSSKIFFQLSIEHADNSPLTYGAEKFEEDGKVDWAYIRDVNRDEEMYISPIIKRVEGHSAIIHNLIELSNGDFITASKDGIIKKWSGKNYESIDETSLDNYPLKINGFGKLCMLSDEKFAVEIFDEEENTSIATINCETLELIHFTFLTTNRLEEIKKINENLFYTYAYNELIVWDFNTLEKIFVHKTKKSIRCTSLESNNIFVVTEDRMDIIDVDKLFIDKTVELKFEIEHLWSLNDSALYAGSFCELLRYSYADENFEEIYSFDRDIMDFIPMDREDAMIHLIDGTNHIFNTVIDDCVRDLKFDGELVYKSKLYNDKYVLRVHKNNTLSMWDLIEDEPKGIFEGSLSKIVGFISTNDKLVAWTHGGEILVWSLNNLENALRSSPKKITFHLELSDNKFITCYGDSSEVTVWDKQGNIERVFEVDTDEKGFESIELLDNKNILFDCLNNSISIYDGNIFKKVYQIDHSDSDYVLFYKLLNNKLLLTYSKDTDPVIYDIDKLSVISKLNKFENGIEDIIILNNGDLLIISEDGIVRFIDIITYKTVVEYQLGDYGFSIENMIENSDKIFIVHDNTAYFIDKHNNYKMIDQKNAHSDTVFGVYPIGEFKAVTYSADCNAIIWDLDLQTAIVLQGHSDEIDSVKVKENKLFTSSYDKTLKVWSLDTFECLSTLPEHKEIVEKFYVIENGDIITQIDDSSDENLFVWDRKNYTLKKRMSLNIKKIIHCDMDNLVVETDSGIVTLDAKNYNFVNSCNNSKDKSFNDIFRQYKLKRTLKDDYIVTSYFRDQTLYLFDKYNQELNIEYHSIYNPLPYLSFGNYILCLENGENAKWLKIYA